MSKPEGDGGRVADLSVAKGVLNWDPKTTLKDGLSITYDYFSKLTLGLCLPLTSRGCNRLEEVKERLKNLW